MNFATTRNLPYIFMCQWNLNMRVIREHWLTNAERLGLVQFQIPDSKGDVYTMADYEIS